jgi:signal peptidase I
MLFVYLLTLGQEIPKALGLQENSNAPGDWIKENKIHVYANAVCIDVENVSLSNYAASGSMRPVLDSNSNGIRVVPRDESELKVGDIVSYEKDKDLIVHRIIEIGSDKKGKWFITKGDNNAGSDGKIRFSDIKYVTIGMLY